ncbi:MAG: hypothetical protein ACE5H0_04395, partial [Bacteroidota bacterium]
MGDFRKILMIWLAFLFVLLASLLLPQKENIYALYGNSIQFLLFIFCIYIIKREANLKNKVIFINFSAFFFLSILLQLSNFVRISLFTHEPFADYYSYVYLTGIAYPLLLAFAIVYVVIDLLFREFKIYQKYLVACLIVFGLAGYYYHPYLQNPKFLYSTSDYRDFKTLDNDGWKPYIAEHGSEPAAEELATVVELPGWGDGERVGVTYESAKLQRVRELYPYFIGNNYMVLLFAPLYKSIISMNVLIIFVLFLYFGYLYKKDPPQGAYIDKIVFLFLIFSSMEILHYWGYINSVHWGTWTEMFGVGQYITIGIFLMMVVFFGLRLRFITSVQGEFYEHELVHSPQHIT